jgi:ComF family protein
MKFKSEGVVRNFLSCYLFEKKGKMQEIVQLLKYGGIRSLGVRLGEEIGARIQENSEFLASDYLIPVPLHTLKRRERGYNQSEYLCRGISERTGIPVHTSLILRIRNTESQTHLNIEQRQENVGGAFAINPKQRMSVQGKSFIIVDDVITTGSTINACARVLRMAGAREVFVASAALAK